MPRITRQRYFELYGPTVGDRLRLGDTELWLEIEQDLLRHGDELVFGAGKTLRAGTGANGDITAADGALDMVITNATIVDAMVGIVKADIGIKDGFIRGIGKAGDPLIMNEVSEHLVCGTSTDVRSGEGLIATAGAIDCHVHFIDPGQCAEAIAAGVTTMVGGGLGATTVPIACSGARNLGIMLRAVEAFPLNFGFLGKAAAHSVEPLAEQIRGGSMGIKVHEDWGAMPAVIDTALQAGDAFDVQIQIHTDTLNESGFLEQTLRAIGGRTIHAYHIEGAAGGHAPDILRICAEENVLPSSTNPTNPYAVNTFDEHFDMIMTSHHLNPRLPEDIAFAESRVRRETIAAEDVLHDIGAISAIGSDSQGMGRIGETITRTWQVASHMKSERGFLPEDGERRNDNARIKRYIAKYTINPARIFGIDRHVGSLQPGKLADIVLWKPKFFGVKPEVVIKGGFPVWSVMGEPNASLMLCAPLIYRPQWGAFGSAPDWLCITFLSEAALQVGLVERLKLRRRYVAVADTRKLTKRDMVWNETLPRIAVDPETYRVEVDGEPCTCKPIERVPLGRLYSLR